MKQTGQRYISFTHLGWIMLIGLSVFMGLASVYVDAIFLIVGVVGLLNVFLIIKYPMWGLILYVIIFLMRPGEMFPAIAALRPELLIGVLVVVTLILHQRILSGGFNVPYDRISLSLVAILIAIGLSFFTSFEKTETKNIVIVFVKLIVFYYLIISLVTTRQRFMAFIVTYLFCIAYMAVDAFGMYLSGAFVHTMNVDRLTGSTSAGGDPNALGATLVVSIPLILATAAYYRNFFVKLIMAGLALLMTVCMVITASRSALLAFFGLIAVGIYQSKHRALNSFLVIIILIIGWFLLPQQYHDRYMRFSEVGDNLNDVSSGRVDIWLSGIRMIPTNPITGVGAGAFAWACSSGEFGPPRFMQSHNLYIEIISSMGIIGVIAWLFFILTLFKKLKWLSQLKHTAESRWISIFSRAFVVTLIALLISGVFGHNLYRYTWFMIAGLTIALSNIWYSEFAHDNSKS